MARYRVITPLNAVTASVANTAAAPIEIGRADKVTFQFTRADHSSGSSLFGVEVSNDGTNWVAYNKLIDNVTNANSETLTRVATSTLSSDTSKVYTMSPEDGYEYLRVYVTETTDGTHTATVYIQQD